MTYMNECSELQGIWTNDKIPLHVVEEIDAAGKNIYFMMFKFDSREVADALIRAAHRGVKIYVLLDNRSRQFSVGGGGHIVDYLMSSGSSNIHLYSYNDTPNILHYKLIMIDSRTLLFGSQNLFQKDINDNYEIYIKLGLSDTCYIPELIAQQFSRICNDDRTHEYISHEKICVPPKTINNHHARTNHLGEAVIRYFAFSPETNAISVVKDLIASAARNIIVIEAFFQNEEIRRALLKSKRKGVDVTVMLDSSFESFSRMLASDGFRIRRYTRPSSIMHYKTILIDGHLTFTGSLNLFERSLKRDRELMILIDSKNLYDGVHAALNDIWNDNYSVEPEAYSAVKYCIKRIINHIPAPVRTRIMNLYYAIRR